MPVEYYRTTDPLENFKLKVCIREVSRVKKSLDLNNEEEEANISEIVSWQQKLFSPAEISDYLLNKTNSSKDSASKVWINKFSFSFLCYILLY